MSKRKSQEQRIFLYGKRCWLDLVAFSSSIGEYFFYRKVSEKMSLENFPSIQRHWCECCVSSSENADTGERDEKLCWVEVWKSSSRVRSYCHHATNAWVRRVERDLLKRTYSLKYIIGIHFHIYNFILGKSPVYTLQLSQKSDFQPSTTKPDNIGHPAVKTG